MKIFYDVDTQLDFIDADGALAVSGAEEICENLGRLTTFAFEEDIQLIGSLDVHKGTEEYKEREGELSKYGGPFPDHCMHGTKGAEKIQETESVFLRVPNPLKGENVDEDAIKRCIEGIYPIYFEKQSYDIFTNPAFSAFLKRYTVKEAVVYGVATDYCVKAAVLGMQKMGIQCYVVKDAIRGVAIPTTAVALKEMRKAGAKFVTTEDILSESANET